MPRLSIGGSRHQSSEMERLVFDLPVPPTETPPRPPSIPEGIYRSGYSDSPARRGVINVSMAQREVSWSSQVATGNPDPTHGQRRGGPPSARVMAPSRMDSMIIPLRAQGFNARTLGTWSHHHADSTVKAYQSVWTNFLEYLSVQGIRHDQIRESDVYNYIQMHMDLDKKQRTLLKYRAAFRHPFKLAYNIDIDSLFGELYVRAAARINPSVISAPMPTWSLDTLLEFLLVERLLAL